MEKVTYKEIAQDLGKSEGTIKQWKINHPVLLDYVKTGAFCKKKQHHHRDDKKLHRT